MGRVHKELPTLNPGRTRFELIKLNDTKSIRFDNIEGSYIRVRHTNMLSRIIN